MNTMRRARTAIAAVVQALILCGPPNPGPPSTTVAPASSASILSRVYFVWANAVVLAAGRLPPIQIRDLPPLPPEDAAEPSCRLIEALWEAERREATRGGRPASLLSALVRFLWRDEALTLVFKLCGWLVAGTVSNAVLLPLVIHSLAPSSPVWLGYVAAVLFLVSEGTRSATVNQRAWGSRRGCAEASSFSHLVDLPLQSGTRRSQLPCASEARCGFSSWKRR